MKNKKAFTLVELLAVIVIMGILLTISIPQLINNLKDKKNDALQTIKETIVSIGKNYAIDNSIEAPFHISINDLCAERYLECPVINPTTNSNLDGYVIIDYNNIYYFSDTIPNRSNLTVNLNGGSTSQTFNPSYLPGTTISLINPTKTGYEFTGWTVSGTAASINGTELTIGTSDTTITANWEANNNPVYSYSCANASAGSSPYALTYTGNCTVIDDGNDNWRVKFLTSGNLTMSSTTIIDAFLVGGGGGGGGQLSNDAYHGGGGGGGGYTTTVYNMALDYQSTYELTIGNGGTAGVASSTKGTAGGTGGSTIFALGSMIIESAGGGAGGKVFNNGGSGGSGGGGKSRFSSGGAGGTDGSNGSVGTGSSEYGSGGTGQGSTTREFGEATGTLYAGGGGGGGFTDSAASAGGSGGGGAGASGNNAGSAGEANTGGGGGGAGGYASNSGSKSGGAGGSGIIIIRNASS